MLHATASPIAVYWPSDVLSICAHCHSVARTRGRLQRPSECTPWHTISLQRCRITCFGLFTLARLPRWTCWENSSITPHAWHECRPQSKILTIPNACWWESRHAIDHVLNARCAIWHLWCFWSLWYFNDGFPDLGLRMTCITPEGHKPQNTLTTIIPTTSTFLQTIYSLIYIKDWRHIQASQWYSGPC